MLEYPVKYGIWLVQVEQDNRGDPAFEGSIGARAEALRLARLAIATYLQTAQIKIRRSSAPLLCRCAGVFVTIRSETTGHEPRSSAALRGCIGTLRTDRPLYRTIQETAVRAATSDPRFPPVQIRELSRINLEISILSRSEPVRDLEQIIIGEHGLMIVEDDRRAILLPQVATNHGWTVEEFVRNLRFKAGLPTGVRQRASTLAMFRATVIEERPS